MARRKKRKAVQLGRSMVMKDRAERQRRKPTRRTVDTEVQKYRGFHYKVKCAARGYTLTYRLPTRKWVTFSATIPTAADVVMTVRRLFRALGESPQLVAELHTETST